MRRYVDFLSGNSKKIMMALAVVNFLAFLGLFRIKINPDFRVFMPERSEQVELYDEMVNIFGVQDQITVVLEFERDPRNPETFEKLREMEEKMEKIDGVESVVGPVPRVIPTGFLKLERVEKIDERNFKRVLEFVEENEVSKSIVEKNGKYYCMFVVFPKPEADMRGIVRGVEVLLRNIRHFLSGNTYVESELFDYILLVLFTLPPAAILLMFLVFKWVIKSAKGTFLSIIPAGIGALWTMGTIGWFLGEITVITVLVPIFTIIMGSADGLHFVSHFLEKIHEGKGKKEAVLETLETIGTAMIMTTLTTMAGFLSLLTIDSSAMKQMGLFSSIGIGLAGVATWIFLPTVLLSVETKGLSAPRSLGVWFGSWSFSKFVPIALIAAFVPGLSMLKTDFNMVDMYKPYTEVRENVEKVKDVFGIYMPVFGMVKSETDPVDPGIAQRTLDYEKNLKDSGLVTRVYSYYDVASHVSKKLYGLKKPVYPENIAKANLVYALMRRNEEKLVDIMIDRREKVARVFVSPVDLRSETLSGIEKISRDMSVVVTGIPYVIEEMNDSIISQQVESILLAITLVFSMLLATQRSFKLAVLSVIPVVSTLVILFGFMGYAGIDLSLITVNMAGITIGVGVDYAIHFVSLYRKLESTFKALETSSKPIIANALGLAVGFSVMNLSPFTFHTYLSAIMWVTMIGSSFLTLTFLPSVLETHRKIQNRSDSQEF